MTHNKVTDAWYEDKKCRQCGKRFTVLHPSRWAYKQPNGARYIFFCSWKCLRAAEKGEERKTMAEEKKTRPRRDRRELLQEILEIYEGEHLAPVEYMRGEGYTTPEAAWHELKTWSRKNAPDLYKRMVEHKLIKPKRLQTEVTTAERLPEAAEGKEPEIELVYDPSIAEEYRKEQEAKAEAEIREERGRRIAEALDRADAKRREMIDGIEPLEVAAVYSRVLEDATFKKINGGMALVGLSLTNPLLLSAYEWFKLTEEILVALRQLDATKPPEADEK